MQKIYLLDIDDVLREKERVISVLDAESLLKAESFALEKDKLRSLGGALLIKTFTTPSALKYNAYNKPYKTEPPFFNVSHSEGLVGIFVNYKSEVGLDIQFIKEYDKKLTDYVFSGDEKDGVISGKEFAVRWAMKEAAAKCVGTGLLSVKRQSISEIKEKTFVFEKQKIYYKNFLLDDYAITACSFKEVTAEILFIDVEFILKTLAKNA